MWYEERFQEIHLFISILLVQIFDLLPTACSGKNLRESAYLTDFLYDDDFICYVSCQWIKQKKKVYFVPGGFGRTPSSYVLFCSYSDKCLCWHTFLSVFSLTLNGPIYNEFLNIQVYGNLVWIKSCMKVRIQMRFPFFPTRSSRQVILIERSLSLSPVRINPQFGILLSPA